MKNISDRVEYALLISINRIIKIMKLTFLILFIFASGVWATEGNSQITKVTLTVESMRFSDVIKTIEKQTDYLFVYNKIDVDLEKKVTVDVQDKNVADVLSGILKDSDMTFAIEGSNIMLMKRRNEVSSSPQIQQQAQKRISGEVTDELGESLIGVNVMEKGTSNGTTTDLDGKFSLSVPENAVLVISYIGYHEQSIAVRNRNIFNIKLVEDIQTLEELVVVGYGTQKKVNLTGAVGTTTGAALENRPISNLSQGLQGLIPNMNVTFSSGQPNSSADINIRGLTSINGGAALILVDGAETSDLSLLDPQSIESITVLKDAASAAIYGARASFGIVLVTTKSGRKNEKAKINYSNNLSWSHITRLPNGVSSDKWIRAMNEANVNNGNGTYFSDAQVAAIDAYIADPAHNPSAFLDETGSFTAKGQWGYAGNTDWFNEIYKNAAFMQQHNVSISGGTDKNAYFASLGYKDQDGLFADGNDHYKRFNLAFNFTSQVTKWLELGFKTKYNKSLADEPNTGFYMGSSVYHEVYRAFPHIPMYLPDGNYAGVEGANFNYNIAALMDMAGRNTTRIDDLWFTGTFTIKPMEKLAIKGDFTQSLYYAQNRKHNKTVYQTMPDPTTTAPLAKGTPNGVYQSKGYNNYQAFNVWADYQDSFNNHNITLIVGYNQEEKIITDLNTLSNSLFDNSFPVSDLAQTFQSIGEASTVWAVQGLFFRASYDYMSKYLLEVNGRYDGSSKYPSGNRWGFFPSASAGWRISEENFFEPLRPALEYLKFRGSYGALGNQVTDGNFQYLGSLGTSTDSKYNYVMNGKKLTLLVPPTLASTNITWEKVQSTNFGIDLSTLNSRLSASFDYFIRSTKDMVVSKAYPSVLGTTGGKENLADMRVKGWELTLTWNDRINNVGGSPLNYSISLGLDDSMAEITKYDNPTGSLSDHYVGKKLGEIWGYVTDGFITTEEEALEMSTVQGALSKTWIPGDIRFRDLDGNKKISTGSNTLEDPGDRKIIGNNTPRYRFSINTTAQWKNFDLRLLFQGVGKRDIALGSSSNVFWGYTSSLWQMSLTDYHIDNSWREDNQNAFYPVALRNARSRQIQTKYLQDGAYIRLKDVTLSYTLPRRFTTKVGIEQLRVFVSGQNLWEATRLFKYLDPDAMTKSDNVGSLTADGKVYPFTRTYSFGLNLSF